MSLLTSEQRRSLLDELSEADVAELLHDWRFWARPNQLPPDGDWTVWLILAGRGFGKTWTGANWVSEQARSVGRIALVGPTAGDVRDIMIEGESGIMTIAAPHWKPTYEPSKRRVTWPNGAIATAYSGDEPDRLRGPQHHVAWVDEWMAFKYPEEAQDMLFFGLRLGEHPRALFTQTPKPMKILKDLMADPTTAVVRGSTYENRDNLAPTFFQKIVSRYEGTRLGRQELNAEILEDVEGALWTQALIDLHRVKAAPELVRVVVAVDPAVSHGPDADETGITVAGKGVDGHCYVLNSTGYRETPKGWADRVLEAYDRHEADKIIAEVNNGGEMVVSTIHSQRATAPVDVIRASRGKTVRAEPVAALYERGFVHHVGTFAGTEQQMCSFPVANDNDDRVDSLVYAVSELLEAAPPAAGDSVDPDDGWADRRRSFAIGKR